jgi:hypothetical protein
VSKPLLKQLYLGAVDIITDPDRWGYDAVRNADKVCAIGAMYDVGERLGLTETQIRAMLGERYIRITDTNDKRGRTAVIALLRKYAAAL